MSAEFSDQVGIHAESTDHLLICARAIPEMCLVNLVDAIQYIRYPLCMFTSIWWRILEFMRFFTHATTQLCNVQKLQLHGLCFFVASTGVG